MPAVVSGGGVVAERAGNQSAATGIPSSVSQANRIHRQCTEVSLASGHGSCELGLSLNRQLASGQLGGRWRLSVRALARYQDHDLPEIECT